jgi:hypothetical protein
MRDLFERFDRLDTTQPLAGRKQHHATTYKLGSRLPCVRGARSSGPLTHRGPGHAHDNRPHFGLVPSMGLVMTAALEVAIGLCFVMGRYLRVGCGLWRHRCWGDVSWCCSRVSYSRAPARTHARGAVHHKGHNSGGCGHGDRSYLDRCAHRGRAKEHGEHPARQESSAGARCRPAPDAPILTAVIGFPLAYIHRVAAKRSSRKPVSTILHGTPASGLWLPSPASSGPEPRHDI